jgi:hypothetical protein
VRALSKLGFDASAVPRRARYFAFRGSKQERKRNGAAHLVKPYPKRQLSAAARAAQHRDGSLLDLKRDSAEDIGRVLADAISENKFKGIVKVATERYKARAKPAG